MDISHRTLWCQWRLESNLVETLLNRFGNGLSANHVGTAFHGHVMPDWRETYVGWTWDAFDWSGRTWLSHQMVRGKGSKLEKLALSNGYPMVIIHYHTISYLILGLVQPLDNITCIGEGWTASRSWCKARSGGTQLVGFLQFQKENPRDDLQRNVALCSLLCQKASLLESLRYLNISWVSFSPRILAVFDKAPLYSASPSVWTIGKAWGQESLTLPNFPEIQNWHK